MNIKRWFHIFHKSKLNIEHKYINHVIEKEDLRFGFIVGMYDVTCPTCGKYQEINRAFPFDTPFYIEECEMKKIRHPELYQHKVITQNQAIIECMNFKGD